MARRCIQVGLGVGLVAAALAFEHRAWAHDPKCETRTERSPTEIIVPFGDGAHPQLPAWAVKLLPGEAICVTGDVVDSGQMSNLRLTGETDTSGPVVQLELERGQQTQLLVRHSSRTSWLYYRALNVVTAQDVAIPTRVLPVSPGLHGLETWDSGVRKLLVYDFRFGPAPATSSSDTVEPKHRQRRDPSRNASATFGFWGGERTLRLGDLERALAREGYGPLSRTSIQGGLDLDFTFWRVRGGVGFGAGGVSPRHRESGEELRTWLTEIAFTAGFDVLSYEQFRAFVSTGIGVSTLYVDRPPEALAFPTLQPWDDERLAWSEFEVPFDLGFEHFFAFGRASTTERWILQLGTRIGWIQQLGHGQWKIDDDNGRDIQGPPVDISGLRARLVLGIGAQNGW